MSRKYHIHTFGCQMNVHDSEKIAGILSEADMKEAAGTNDADVIVLNTCSIREKAEQKFYSELGRLRKMKKSRPGLKIAVAGCIARQEGERIFRKYPYVDYVFGPANIDALKQWIEKDENPDSGDNGHHSVAVEEPPDYHTRRLPVKREGRVRAWISIMYGCDNFCAYCVVPYTRGRERSRPPREILEEVNRVADEGFKEITLLGQNVNSYGRGLQPPVDFPDLLSMVNDVDGIQRIRFVTSHPKDLSDRLIDAMAALPKVCEHIHLPLQAGSDRILKLMNRRYTLSDYMERLKRLKEAIPGIAVTSDIIVGFPGETGEDFEKTIAALEEIRFDGIFAFKYSRRPGTKALSLPDHVDERTKAERLEKVLKLQEVITAEKNFLLEGTVVEVLVEGQSESDPGMMTGRTRTNKIVNFRAPRSIIGSLVDIKIEKAMLHSLLGESLD